MVAVAETMLSLRLRLRSWLLFNKLRFNIMMNSKLVTEVVATMMVAYQKPMCVEGVVEVDRQVMVDGCVVQEWGGPPFLGLPLPLPHISEAQT